MMTLEPMTITRKAGIATGTDDDAAGTPATPWAQPAWTTQSWGDTGTAILEPGDTPPASPTAVYDDEDDDEDFFDDDDDDDGEDTFDEFDDFDEDDGQDDDDEDDDDL